MTLEAFENNEIKFRVVSFTESTNQSFRLCYDNGNFLASGNSSGFVILNVKTVQYLKAFY